MSRATFFIVSLLVASTQADDDAAAQAGCALDGASAVSDLTDAAVYLWAATQRCSVSSGVGNPLAPRCEVDIAAAMQAVNNMIMVIVKAAKDCGSFEAANYECGQAVGKLTGASAGLSAGIGGMTHSCVPGLPSSGPVGLGVADSTATLIGQCVTDAKNSVGNLFKASNSLASVTPNCEAGGPECARNALSVVSFFANMGAALAGTAQHCGAYDHANFKGAGCANAVLHSVSMLSAISNAAIGVADACKTPEGELQRLYRVEKVQQSGTPMSMIAMGAFLPIAAVLSFVGGYRVAKLPTKRSTRELEPDQEALTGVTEL